jgi:hypothetical protein
MYLPRLNTSMPRGAIFRCIYQLHVDAWVWLNKFRFKLFDKWRALNHRISGDLVSELGIAILLGLINAGARVNKIMASREEVLYVKRRVESRHC